MKLYIRSLCYAVAVSFLAACANSGKGNLKGEWRSKDGETRLKITGKEFVMDNGSPLPEDYIMKGDTILTSYEGSQPYTKFVIQQLDDHNLKLLYPDSITVEFTR